MIKYFVLGHAFGFDTIMVLGEFTNSKEAYDYCHNVAPIQWQCDDAYVCTLTVA